MTTNPSLAPILVSLTPESLAHLVRQLAERQPAGAREDVSLPSIMGALLEGVDLGGPAETWSAQLALKRAIAETVALIPGMDYVEGDS
jgi:hypothetical protein